MKVFELYSKRQKKIRREVPEVYQYDMIPVELRIQNGLIPTFMQTHFTALKSTLKNGVPTVRNRLGAHGQGSEEIEVPESIAAYTLHLTASNILLLGRAEKEMK